MASSKKLQGITIEIDGNTSKLSDSLKDVNKVIVSTQSELKNINSLLKLDPTNTTLLAQRQQVLADTIKGTSEKLNQLREAKKQADKRIASGVEDKNSASYRELEREIIATESSLNKLNDELKENSLNAKQAGDNTSRFGDVLKANLLSSAIQSAVTNLANGFSQIASKLGDVGKQAFEGYMQYEQLAGGVQKIFDEMDNTKVFEDANEAYLTLGMSANQYLETMNSVGATFSATMGDEKGYETAKIGLQAISDFASGTGKSVDELSSKFTLISRATSSYQSIADQFSGILPATSKDFLDQAKKAGLLRKEYKKLTDVPVAEYQEALAKMMQKGTEELGLMGNTQMEATETISGSLAMLKSSWENLLTGMASGNANFEKLINNFLRSVVTVGNNIVPIISNIVNGMVKMLPQILSIGTQMILELIKGIVEAIPMLVPEFTKIIIQMVNAVIDNIPLLIDAGIEMLVGLVLGIIEAIPILIDAVPTIIVKLVTALNNPERLAKLISAGIKLLVALGSGLVKAIPQVIGLIPSIISKLFNSIKDTITKTNWLSLGKNILKGILNGMIDFGTVVKDTVKKVGKKITSEIKSFFGIKSPSRLMKKEVGQYLASGIAKGFEEEMPNTIRDVENSLSSLNSGIQASINPTINPQANTNPLIIQIENFNNTRETDIQALAEELEFYRKNSSLAVGGN